MPECKFFKQLRLRSGESGSSGADCCALHGIAENPNTTMAMSANLGIQHLFGMLARGLEAVGEGDFAGDNEVRQISTEGAHSEKPSTGKFTTRLIPGLCGRSLSGRSCWVPTKIAELGICLSQVL